MEDIQAAVILAAAHAHGHPGQVIIIQIHAHQHAADAAGRCTIVFVITIGVLQKHADKS